MKRWLSKLAKLTVVMALLSVFATAAFAMETVEVNATVVDGGVEVEWNYLAQHKGKEVWCAAYAADGRMLKVAQADMNALGQACRIYCDVSQVAKVKLFLIGEQLQPAEDVEITGQNETQDSQDHVCIWQAESVTIKPTLFEPGEAEARCGVCGEVESRVIPATSDPEERLLVKQAEELGLLQYLELEDLDDATRLDVAKLVAVITGRDVVSTPDCKFADCADLTDMEKGILNAVVEGGFLNGSGDGNFHPEAKVTRNEFTVVLMNCLGGPKTEWVRTYPDIPQWAEPYANNLYNLGILGDEPNFYGNNYATKADVLQWMVNAKEWVDEFTELSRPRNLRFGTNGKWLYWDADTVGVTNVRYTVWGRHAATGEWEILSDRVSPKDQNGMCTRWRYAESFDAIEVDVMVGARPYGGCPDDDMTLRISRSESNGAQVELIETTGGKALSITGLPANETVRVILSDEVIHTAYNDAFSYRTDDTGALVVPAPDYQPDVLDGEFWYAIESFNDYNVSADGKHLEYTVVCYGEGHVKPTPVIPGATADQQALVEKANNAGLLEYLDLTDLGNLTRLDAAKLVMGLGNYKMGDGSSLTFTDISDLTQQEKDIVAAIVYQEGLMSGISATTFAPNDTMSNAQVLVMLYQAMGEPNGPVREANDWQLFTVEQMTALGILQNGDPSVSAAATKESALTWMLRVKDWQKGNPGGGSDQVSDPAYEVTDAYFGMDKGEVPVMFYTLPATIDEDVRVDLYVRNADGEWECAMGSNQGYQLVADWLEPGFYDEFMLVSVTNADDKVHAWVHVDDLKLTINPGGVSSAQVTFEKIDNTYRWEAVHGHADTCFSMEIVEEGSGSFRPTGCFNADGVGSGTESGDRAISHIENGTFILREYRDLDISSKNLSVTIWATEEKPCLPMDPAYAATNLHFERNQNGMLFIAWDEPAAAAGQDVEYAFQFYRAGDNSKNDWSGRTDQNRLAMWKFGATNYDRLYVKTIVDGVAKGEQMFQGNLVTITEGTAPNVQLTYTQTGHDYEMKLVGNPNTLYVMTYQNANNSIVTYSPVTDANGVYTEKVTNSFRIDCIENGSINVMTYGNLSYSGSSCSYTSNDTGWMKGSDLIIAAPNDPAYAVTNVRFGFLPEYDHLALLFDEPQNVTGNVEYDLRMVNVDTGESYGRGSNSYWDGNQDKQYIFLGNYDHGTYEDMVIYTYVDGELKGWTELDGYSFSMEDVGENDLRVDFTFVGTSQNKEYECTVSGDPNFRFMIEAFDGNGSSSQSGKLDTTGKWSKIGTIFRNVDFIENGTFRVREYDTVNITGTTCDVLYRDSRTWKCLRGYGYVISEPERQKTEKGDEVDYITFWDGEENIVLQAKHQFTGVLAKGDFFSYRLEVRDDGELRLGEIIKNDGKVGEVTDCSDGMTPEWIVLDRKHYDCVEPPILVYVDMEECEGAVADGIESGKKIRYVLNDVGKIAAVFVDVNGDVETGEVLSTTSIYAANGTLSLEWEAKENYTGYYYVNGTRSGTNPFHHLETTVRSATAPGTYSFTVATTPDNGATLNTWAEAKDVLTVVFDENAVPDVSIVGQADGSYKFIPNDDFTGAYDFTMYSPEGDIIRSWYVGANKTTTVAPYPGCYFEVRELGWPLGEDLTNVTATISGTKQFGFTAYDFTGTEVSITADDEAALTAALKAGGKVTLESDVTITNSTINQGGDVILDLNGHTIDIGSRNTWGFAYGKKVTILDSSAAKTGKIIGTSGLSAYGCASLNLKDIQVDRLYTSASGGGVRSVSAENCTFTYLVDIENTESAMFTNCDFACELHVRIKNSSAVFNGGTITDTSDTWALAVSNLADVEFNDVTVNVAHIQVDSGTLTINSGSYTDNYVGNNVGLIKVNPGASAVIKGGTFNFDPSEFMDDDFCTIIENGDGTWSVGTESKPALSLRAWSTDVMLDGFSDIYTETYSVEDNGTTVASFGTSVLSELLLRIDQSVYTDGITDADLVVTDGGNELARLPAALNVTIAGEPVEYSFEDGVVNIAAPVKGTYVYAVYQDGVYRSGGRIVYTGSDYSFAPPTLTDGQEIRIIYCDCTLSDDKLKVSAVITPVSVQTYTESAAGTSITFVQDGDSITANWSGFSETRYAYCLRDENNTRATGYYWAQEGSQTSYDLLYQIPRLNSGTASYDFVLYAITNNSIGDEIARVENAVEVTVAGEAVEYEMAFNDGTAGVHNISWVGSEPTGVWCLSAWYAVGDTISYNVGSASITPKVTVNRELKDADVFDLRIMTDFALDGQTVRATITPASTKTYTESV